MITVIKSGEGKVGIGAFCDEKLGTCILFEPLDEQLKIGEVSRKLKQNKVFTPNDGSIVIVLNNLASAFILKEMVDRAIKMLEYEKTN